MLKIRLSTLAFALMLVDVSIVLACTKEQNSEVVKAISAVPAKCTIQRQFQVCDDDCLAGYRTRKEKSPICVLPGSSTTTLEDATKAYEDCKKDRGGSTDDKYMPQGSLGALPKCTEQQDDEWDGKYGSVGAAFRVCWSNASPSKGCSDECLKTIEEGISAAPACADSSGYWYGEGEKYYLVRCLRARKDKLENNMVLNTVINADGSKTTGVKPTISLDSSSTRNSIAVGSVGLVVTAVACVL